VKDATFGGYLAAHDRPPAFEGADGRAYSADLWVDEQPQPDGRFGAAFLFIRWNPAGEAPDAHVESEYVAWGADRAEAEARLKAVALHEIKALLDRAIARQAALGDW
jgi:hypothetical protein